MAAIECFWNEVLLLAGLHLTAIAITPLVISLPVVDLLWPACYLAILIAVGHRYQQRKRPPLATLLSGFVSQLPGIIAATPVLIGIITRHQTSEILDFINQIWQSPFNSWFPCLPHSQPAGIPFYYLVTLLLSFVLPLFPLAGSLLATRREKS